MFEDTEVYTLTLEHECWCKDGEVIRLEFPMRGYFYKTLSSEYSKDYILDCLFEKLRNGVVDK